ncbi:hypothetical protein D9M69_672280 [compost metagenome]
MQRYFAKERHIETFRFLTCAAMAENIVACASIRRDEIAHILDNAQKRHINLAEHGQSLACIDQRQILRR